MDSNLPLSGKVRLARCSLSRGQERLAACNQCNAVVLTLSTKCRTWLCGARRRPAFEPWAAKTLMQVRDRRVWVAERDRPVLFKPADWLNRSKRGERKLFIAPPPRIFKIFELA